MTPGACVLETENLTRSFSGFTAVSRVNLRVRRGTIQAPIGPNGAGSTPEELEQVIRSESEKWKKVIEISGATAE